MSGAVLNGGGPLSSGCAPPPDLESEKFGVGDPGGGLELSGTNRGPPPPGPPPPPELGAELGGALGGAPGSFLWGAGRATGETPEMGGRGC